MNMPPEIFDPARRRAIHARAAKLYQTGADSAPVIAIMAEELLARLEFVQRDFADILLLGVDQTDLHDALAKRAHSHGGRLISAGPHSWRADADYIQCAEDRLPFAAHSFDLVIANATLESVNDLPGALVQIRRILRPDGLMLAAMTAAGSFARLKSAMLAGDEAMGRGAAAHIHPQIDVRAVGDLLQRAGFALPVVDLDQLGLRYGDLSGLLGDMRSHGWSNMLKSPAPFIGRFGLSAAFADFASTAEPDGRISETVNLLYLSGWAPLPDQLKPAKRGSGSVSLADALKSKG